MSRRYEFWYELDFVQVQQKCINLKILFLKKKGKKAFNDSKSEEFFVQFLGFEPKLHVIIVEVCYRPLMNHLN